MASPLENSPYGSIAGEQIQVTDEIEPKEDSKWSVANATQAIAICRNLRQSWISGIENAALITSQLNGQPPRNAATLRQLGKSWFPNISTGFLRTQCNGIPSRFSTPVLSAQYLSAAELPAGWARGAEKADFFRDEFSQLMRRWDRFQWFVERLCREVGFFGLGYAAYFDEYEWRPTFVRQDQGFVPVGTEIDEDPQFFLCLYNYRVDELIRLVEKQREAGLEGWNLDNVAMAINAAAPKAVDSSVYNSRKYEEMVRQATIGQSYEIGYNTIQTQHLFSVDPDGKVSHHIVLADQASTDVPTSSGITIDQANTSELFVKRSQFPAMKDVVTPMVFGMDDGTLQGSWGAGQQLFDISIQFEKSFNDWIAANQMISRIKTFTNEGVNADEVLLKVQEGLMVLQGAQYGGNVAACVTDPKPFLELQKAFTIAAREKIGDALPPISLTPNDIKAAQIDYNVRQQQEQREQILVRWLMQFGRMLAMVTRRACNKECPDEDAKKFREALEEVLSDEEITLLANQPPLKSIYDYTTYSLEKRAAFAATKQGNPYFDQRALERVQSIAAGGRSFADAIMQPGSDPTGQDAAARQQDEETTTLLRGKPVKVLAYDQDFYHMEALRPDLEAAITQQNPYSQIILDHYVQHYIGGTAKKTIPGDGNAIKEAIFKMQDAIETGVIPPEGFAVQPDIIDAMEQQMAQGPVTQPGPEEVEAPLTEANVEETVESV